MVGPKTSIRWGPPGPSLGKLPYQTGSCLSPPDLKVYALALLQAVAICNIR